MPAAQAPPFSTRLPVDVQTAMEARLAKTGEKRNAMMVRLIRADLGLDAPSKAPARVTGALKPHEGRDGVHIGPVASKPGERLKQTARGKSKWAL